jgi:hypothetical protein
MAAKNALATADSAVVEAAFAARLADLTDGGAEEATPPTAAPNAEAPKREEEKGGHNPSLNSAVPLEQTADFEPSKRVNNAVAWHIDKGALTLNEPRRYRDRAHLEFVSKQPCLLCGRSPSDAHHLRFAQPRALGRRVSDEYTVPLCRTHHRALHRRGDEVAWWASVNIDAVTLAHELWEWTRLNSAADEGRKDRQVFVERS